MTPITLLAEAPVERLGNPVDVELDSEQVGECNAGVHAWFPDWLRGDWQRSQR